MDQIYIGDYAIAMIKHDILHIDYLKCMDPNEVPEFVKRDMAEQISMDIAKYLDISTYIDPINYEQHFLGRLKFVLPE